MAVHSARNDYPNMTLVTMNPGWVRTDMGGAQAPTSVAQSVSGMLSVIEKTKPSERGSFQSYDGRKMGWYHQIEKNYGYQRDGISNFL